LLQFMIGESAASAASATSERRLMVITFSSNALM
jgi:hypothetical protein